MSITTIWHTLNEDVGSVSFRLPHGCRCYVFHGTHELVALYSVTDQENPTVHVPLFYAIRNTIEEKANAAADLLMQNKSFINKRRSLGGSRSGN
jgi:hypothetical protein